MPLTREQKKRLVDLLLSTPPTASFGGRTALLSGATVVKSLNRDPANARLDLELIVEQLESLGAPGLLAELTENATAYVTGTAVARDLEALRRAIEAPPSPPVVGAPPRSTTRRAPTRASTRRLLHAVLRGDSDFEAFVGDSFR